MTAYPFTQVRLVLHLLVILALLLGVLPPAPVRAAIGQRTQSAEHKTDAPHPALATPVVEVGAPERENGERRTQNVEQPALPDSTPLSALRCERRTQLFLPLVYGQTPARPGVVEVEVTPAVGMAPLTVTVAALLDGGVAAEAPYDFAWRFGDGALAHGPTARHVYEQAGVYTVTLTASNELGEQRVD